MRNTHLAHREPSTNANHAVTDAAVAITHRRPSARRRGYRRTDKLQSGLPNPRLVTEEENGHNREVGGLSLSVLSYYGSMLFPQNFNKKGLNTTLLWYCLYIYIYIYIIKYVYVLKAYPES